MLVCSRGGKDSGLFVGCVQNDQDDEQEANFPCSNEKYNWKNDALE
jgi:hypothetical protein